MGHRNGQRRIVQIIELIGITALIDQRLHNVTAVLVRCLVEQIQLVAAPAVAVALQEELKELEVALGQSQRDRCVARAVGVYLGAYAHEPFGDLVLFVVGRHVEECVATAILQVGVLGSHELLQVLQVTCLNCVEYLVLY